MMHRSLSTALALSLAACAAPADPAPAPRPEPPRARAALASVHVVNLTPQRLAVSYRIASRDSTEVGIGRVPPRSTVHLAPVPAGEPLVLLARTDAGAELRLPPRSFALDAEWTWRIPPDARFTPAAPRPDR